MQVCKFCRRRQSGRDLQHQEDSGGAPREAGGEMQRLSCRPPEIHWSGRQQSCNTGARPSPKERLVHFSSDLTLRRAGTTTGKHPKIVFLIKESVCVYPMYSSEEAQITKLFNDNVALNATGLSYQNTILHYIIVS